jgi:hypothetical protein
MTHHTGKNWGNLTIADGGRAGEHRTRAELELERTVRALFYAMHTKDGHAISKNFRNVARGHTRPLRTLVKRLREAQERRCPVAYENSKDVVRALDRFIDTIHGKTQHDDGRSVA